MRSKIAIVVLISIVTIEPYKVVSAFLTTRPWLFFRPIEQIVYPHHDTLRDKKLWTIRQYQRHHHGRIHRTKAKKSKQTNSNEQQQQPQSPIPVMPSPLFQQLALSQLELLASALPHPSQPKRSKIKTMALYLPQENVMTGQLEFSPAVLFPHPNNERIFIANDAQTGIAPALPRTLTTLPGFAHATSLLPAYPMVSSTGSEEASVGVVEEVMCDVQMGGTALSVPLFRGSQTVGVLLVSPAIYSGTFTNNKDRTSSFWTKEDRHIVARAAKSLSLALSMDTERYVLQQQNDIVYESLSDNIHQFKNPLQALRTFGKLLQQRIADTESTVASRKVNNIPRILELTEHIIAQSDRLVERLKPVDAIIETMGEQRRPRAALNPVQLNSNALVPWKTPYRLVNDDDYNNYDIDTLQQQRRRSRKMKGTERLNVILNATEVTYSSMDSDEYAMTVLRDKDPSNSAPKTTSRQRTNLLSTTDTIQLAKHVNGQNQQIEPRLPSAASSSMVSMVMDLRMSFIMDVLEPILSAFHAIANENGISFRVEEMDELPGVTVSGQALQEAFSNVLDNAFKYVVLSKSVDGSRSSQRNPNPQVIVRLLPNETPIPPGVTIFIEDNGPGIPIDERAIVFERGIRSPRTKDLVQGSGIGLTIARSLMEAMGGTLDIMDRSSSKNNNDRSLDGTIVKMTLFRSNMKK